MRGLRCNPAIGIFALVICDYDSRLFATSKKFLCARLTLSGVRLGVCVCVCAVTVTVQDQPPAFASSHAQAQAPAPIHMCAQAPAHTHVLVHGHDQAHALASPPHAQASMLVRALPYATQAVAQSVGQVSAVARVLKGIAGVLQCIVPATLCSLTTVSLLLCATFMQLILSRAQHFQSGIADASAILAASTGAPEAKCGLFDPHSQDAPKWLNKGFGSA